MIMLAAIKVFFKINITLLKCQITPSGVITHRLEPLLQIIFRCLLSRLHFSQKLAALVALLVIKTNINCRRTVKTIKSLKNGVQNIKNSNAIIFEARCGKS